MHLSALGLDGRVHDVGAARDALLRLLVVAVDSAPGFPVASVCGIWRGAAQSFLAIDVAADEAVGVAMVFDHSGCGRGSDWPVLMLLLLLLDLDFALAAAVAEEEENDGKDETTNNDKSADDTANNGGRVVGAPCSLLDGQRSVAVARCGARGGSWGGRSDCVATSGGAVPFVEEGDICSHRRICAAKLFHGGHS